MGMRRYLIVLDMDFLAADEELDLEPINYLVAEQERGPCEAVVLSLTDTSGSKMPGTEMLLGANMGVFPRAPRPKHNVGAAAGHRMNLTVRHLTAIGCAASGFISDEDDLVKTVMSEVHHRDYDAVLLVSTRQRGSALARLLRLDPKGRLRRRLGRKLVVFPLGAGASHPTLFD
jgi:hypothetical protein